jgi:hypothetical protein
MTVNSSLDQTPRKLTEHLDETLGSCIPSENTSREAVNAKEESEVIVAKNSASSRLRLQLMSKKLPFLLQERQTARTETAQMIQTIHSTGQNGGGICRSLLLQ